MEVNLLKLVLIAKQNLATSPTVRSQDQFLNFSRNIFSRNSRVGTLNISLVAITIFSITFFFYTLQSIKLHAILIIQSKLVHFRIRCSLKLAVGKIEKFLLQNGNSEELFQKTLIFECKTGDAVVWIICFCKFRVTGSDWFRKIVVLKFLRSTEVSL